MGSHNSSLAEFHENLDELCDTCTTHFGELYRICDQDDEVTEASKNSTLTPERRAILEQLRLASYKADWFSPDVAGLGILQAMESFSPFGSLYDVEFYLKRCREACGYDESTSVCRRALDVFESELLSVHRQLKDRFLEWPRPEMATIMHKIQRMQTQLLERRLFQLCEEASTTPPRSMGVEAKNSRESLQRPVVTEENGLSQSGATGDSAADKTGGVEPPLPQRTHSDCFSSVTWDDATFVFTPAQATVVRSLWDAMNSGNPVLLDSLLLERSGSNANALRSVFHSNGRSHPAWGTMIIKVGRHARQLCPPKSESHG